MASKGVSDGTTGASRVLGSATFKRPPTPVFDDENALSQQLQVWGMKAFLLFTNIYIHKREYFVLDIISKRLTMPETV